MTSFTRDWKRLVAVLIAGVAGLFVLLDAAINVGINQVPPLSLVASYLVNWATILIALALLVGLLSVASSHARRVGRRQADWGYSLILLLGMVGVIVVGILGVPGVVVMPETLAEEPVRRFFAAVYQPLAGSLLALLSFFSLSAALRSLRRRNAEALVIVLVAVVVLITQFTPLANVPLVGSTLQWINDFVVLAGARGLLIGVALGTLVASMRVLLGFDQPYLDR